jgi:hypothetical protein
MTKLPAFQFYPGDWQKDPSLRVCSHAAKGVLMDTTCIMFECDPRGVLITGDRVWSDRDWAAAVGGNADVTLGCIRELVERGAVKQRGKESQAFVIEHSAILEGVPTGAYYSFRLVRDEYSRVLGRERQAEFRSRKRNGESNDDVTGVSHPSSSSTSPSGTTATNKPPPGNGMRWPKEDEAVAYGERIGLPAEESKRFWHHYESMGWIDKNGHAIHNWQSKLTIWKTESQQRGHITRTSSNGNGDTFWKDSKRLEIIEAEIRAIESRASHTAMDVIIQPQDKEKYSALRKERKGLKNKIGAPTA